MDEELEENTEVEVFMTHTCENCGEDEDIPVETIHHDDPLFCKKCGGELR